MDQDTRWIEYRDGLCKPIEQDLLGYPVQNKERLISAIISNQKLNEPLSFPQLTKIPMDKSLETIGDYVLDFVIMDHFASETNHTAKEIDDFRQIYGRNETLQEYSKKMIKLQNFILWGPDEDRQKKWDQQTTIILAKRFEMLIAIIYLEKGLDAVKEFLKNHNFFQEMDKIRSAGKIFQKIG
jgi:dsRNA-specific ribonuclease